MESGLRTKTNCPFVVSPSVFRPLIRHTRDASGNVVGWVASVTDITERKRIEKQLKAANAFLSAIIENIPLMLFIKKSK